MADMLNPDRMDAPSVHFSDLPEGMGEKVEVGDTIVAKHGHEETSAEVIDIDKAGECIYLSKELPLEGADISIQETAGRTEAPYDAMRKAAADDHSDDVVMPTKDDLTGPLPNLKKLLIQISIEQGDCNE